MGISQRNEEKGSMQPAKVSPRRYNYGDPYLVLPSALSLLAVECCAMVKWVDGPTRTCVMQVSSTPSRTVLSLLGNRPTSFRVCDSRVMFRVNWLDDFIRNNNK